MKKILCIILIFMTILSSGCVEKKVKPSTSRKYLVYNLGELPEDLMMLSSNSLREKDLLLALFEGLVREDKNGQIVPAMAEVYSVSKDGIGYTFKLRKDIYYSDGRVIKAIDFERFFYGILLDKDNIFAKQLYCVFGAKEFSEGKVGFEKVAIVAKDDVTLEIRLNSPNEYFLNTLCNPVLTLREDNTDMKNWKDSYEKISFTGPFIIKSINKDGEVSLLKNNKYWRKDEIVSNEMLFTSIKDEENTLANFETNDSSGDSKVDVFVNPPISEGISLSMEKKTMAVPTQSMYYINFNLNANSPVEDKNFRNVISSIISKEFIIQTISKDLAVPAANYLPLKEGNGSSKVIFDIFGNRKKGMEYLDKYLKSSKYPVKQKITMIYEGEELDSRIAKEISKNLKENIDEMAKNIKGYLDLKEYLDLNILCVGYKKDELSEVLRQGNYDMIFSRINGEYEDAYKFFSRWTTNSKYNIYGYSNLDYDAMIERALVERDSKNKVKIYNEAQQILAKGLPCIPVFIVNTVICKKDNIKDIYTTKDGNLKFDYAYKENTVEVK